MLGNESILVVDYRIDADILYRYHSKIVERIVPWGSEAGAWRSAAGNWQPFIPEIHVGSLEEIARRPKEAIAPRRRRQIDACCFLIERFPEEARDAVRVFPSSHWQLLQFVNKGGAPALKLLRSNPALGYLAAMESAAGQIGLGRRLARSAAAVVCVFPERSGAEKPQLLRRTV